MRIDSKLWLLALAAAGWMACGGPETFSIELATVDNCNNLVDLVQPGHRVKLTVSGPGMAPIVVEADGASGGVEIPDIPAGKDRVVAVEVREPNGDLYARGESAAFEVKEDGTSTVRVVLYRTNYFSRVVGPNGACSAMRQARAGHAAAPLSDHRVLIAGGYTGLRDDGQTPDGILDSVEIFDARAGTFQRGPSLPEPRALARAVSLGDGRVLLVGGVKDEGGAIVPRKDAFLFDGRSWKTIPTAVARRGHTVTLVAATGHVLVVGGVDENDEVVSTVEVFDPDTETFSELDLGERGGDLARAFHGAVNAGQGGSAVAVVGGIDGEGRVTGLVNLLQWDNLQKTYILSRTYQLATPVMLPATMVLGSAAGPRLVVAGGATAYVAGPGRPGAGSPSGETSVVQHMDAMSGTGLGSAELHAGTAVMEACGVALDSSRGLVLGGWRRNVGPLGVGDLVRLVSGTISVSQAGESSGRMKALKHLACTPLGQNGVLVTGGFDENANASDVALVYFLKAETGRAN